MKKTSPEDLERTYDKADPWGYQTNPADIARKQRILDHLNYLGPFEKALDIACGEGWITKDIPAKAIFGYERSFQAMNRWSDKISALNPFCLPKEFDLVMVTGALYENYDWKGITDLINHNASKYILISNIADRELPQAVAAIDAEQIHSEEFPYHRPPEQFTQRLRIFRK